MQELGLIFIMVFIFFISINAVVYHSPRTNTNYVDNETFIVNKTQWIGLNNTFIEEGSEKVYLSDGTIANKTNYELDYEGGDIYLKESYNGVEGNNNTIKYDYNTHTRFKNLITRVTQPFLLGILLAVIGAAALWVGDFS